MHGPCEAREEETARIINAFLRALPAAARRDVLAAMERRQFSPG
jgi:hypothetical protein